MKRFFLLAVLAVLLHPGIDAQVNFLTASDSLNTSSPIEGTYSAFEVIRDTMYAIEGNTIYILDLKEGHTIEYSTLPDEAYTGFPSFITISPNQMNLWVGFTTSDNSDDRIYNLDMFEKTWMHIATMPANFDLAYWNDRVLVSGLNSMSWSDPNGIWLLDESGNNEHRLLIVTGGYSSGLDTDGEGNVYYASSYFSDNVLLKWNATDIASTIESSQDTLKTEAATVLSTLPAGAYDIDLDIAGNIIFNCNNFVQNFIGVSNGSSYDTLATTDLFLTKLSARGNVQNTRATDQVYVQAYGTEIAEIHRDVPPVVSAPIPDLTIMTDESEGYAFNLFDVFHDDDDHDSIFSFALLENSNPDVVYCALDEHSLILHHAQATPGTAEIIVQASSHVYSINDTVGITVSFPAGIEDQDPGEAIMVYPNPASNFVKISAQDLEHGMVSILDMNGRTVLRQGYEQSNDAIDISSLTPGNYLLVLRKDDLLYRTMILKK